MRLDIEAKIFFKTHFILQQFIFSMLKDYKPDMIFHSMTLKVHTIAHKVYTATPKRVKKGASREMLWWKQAYLYRIFDNCRGKQQSFQKKPAFITAFPCLLSLFYSIWHWSICVMASLIQKHNWINHITMQKKVILHNILHGDINNPDAFLNQR